MSVQNIQRIDPMQMFPHHGMPYHHFLHFFFFTFVIIIVARNISFIAENLAHRNGR